MKDRINITLVQPDIIWEDVVQNLKMLDSMLEGNLENTELLILPETFSTGFTMRADHFAEEENGMAVSWMQNLARDKDICVTGSLILREGKRIYNRLYWIDPNGIVGQYDKRHLFRMGREDEQFTPR